MKKLIIFIILVGAILVFLANFGFIKTTDKLMMYKKKGISLKGNFVNVENWKAKDLAKNPYISKVLLKKGYEDLVDKIKKKVEKAKINEKIKNTKENIDKLLN